MGGILRLAKDYPDADVVPAMELVASRLAAMPKARVEPAALKAVRDWLATARS